MALLIVIPILANVNDIPRTKLRFCLFPSVGVVCCKYAIDFRRDSIPRVSARNEIVKREEDEMIA